MSPARLKTTTIGLMMSSSLRPGCVSNKLLSHGPKMLLCLPCSTSDWCFSARFPKISVAMDRTRSMLPALRLVEFGASSSVTSTDGRKDPP